ncbi:MAG TPA: hypothetical protein VF599_11980 [Pyrinomonadaceae bacterium]
MKKIVLGINSFTLAAADVRIGDSMNATKYPRSSGNVSSGSGSGGGLLGGVGNAVGGALTATMPTVSGVTNTPGLNSGTAARTLGCTTNGIRIFELTGASANGSARRRFPQTVIICGWKRASSFDEG